METKLYLPNATLFVFDLANENVEVPEYIEEVLTASNPSCVSVGTQAEVDGEVSVHLFYKDTVIEKGSCFIVYKGVVVTPGNKIAVVTAEMDKVLEMDVDSEETLVSIWVDHQQYPSLVMIEVG